MFWAGLFTVMVVCYGFDLIANRQMRTMRLQKQILIELRRQNAAAKPDNHPVFGRLYSTEELLNEAR